MPVSSRIPDLAALDALVTVARCGSMGAAAGQLGLSQQAVSARVRSAETQLGLAVFTRSPRGVEPTPAGQGVLGWALEVLRAAEELDAGAAALRGDTTAGATVAVSHTVSEWLFPRWAADLRRANPRVRILTRLGNSDEVVAAVREGAVDLGFVEGPEAPSGVAHADVAADELMVVVPPGHPWARVRRPVTAAQLAVTPLVVRERGSGTRQTFEEGLRALGFTPAVPLMELGSTASVRSAVLAADAPAVLSSLAVHRDVEDGRLVVVPVVDVTWPRTLRAVWNRHRRPTGVAADLLRLALADGEGGPTVGG